MKNPYRLVAVTGVLLAAFALSAFAGTWSDPTQSPPNGNVDGPVNVGSTKQEKVGSLQIDGDLSALGKIFLSATGRNVGDVLSVKDVTTGEMQWTTPTSGGTPDTYVKSISIYKVVSADDTTNAADGTGDRATGTATCNAGDWAVGGGIDTDLKSGTPNTVEYTSPLPGNNSAWYAGMYRQAAATMRTYAICMHIVAVAPPPPPATGVTVMAPNGTYAGGGQPKGTISYRLNGGSSISFCSLSCSDTDGKTLSMQVGDTVVFTATSNSSYAFNHWTSCDASTASTCTMTMTQAGTRTVTATYN